MDVHSAVPTPPSSVKVINLGQNHKMDWFVPFIISAFLFNLPYKIWISFSFIPLREGAKKTFFSGHVWKILTPRCIHYLCLKKKNISVFFYAIPNSIWIAISFITLILHIFFFDLLNCKNHYFLSPNPAGSNFYMCIISYSKCYFFPLVKVFFESHLFFDLFFL